VAGSLVRLASSERGAIPVIEVQGVGSLIAPRTISRSAVLLIGGRQPSQPAKSPSRYMMAVNHRGMLILRAGFHPNHCPEDSDNVVERQAFGFGEVQLNTGWRIGSKEPQDGGDNVIEMDDLQQAGIRHTRYDRQTGEAAE
jgi:hypothetical protein